MQLCRPFEARAFDENCGITREILPIRGEQGESRKGARSLDIEFLILRDRFINSMIRDGYRRIDVCRMLLLDRYERKRVYSLKTIEDDQLSILIFTRFVNVKIGSFSFRPSAPPFFLFLFLLFVNSRGQILQLIGTSFNSSKIHWQVIILFFFNNPTATRSIVEISILGPPPPLVSRY